MKSIESLLDAVVNLPDSIEFSDVMAVIDENYDYVPTAFTCGEIKNDAGSNEGSCKILAFAQLHDLSEPAALSLFGRFYREDVLLNSKGKDHGNIRNFMASGWRGVSFSSEPLVLK